MLSPTPSIHPIALGNSVYTCKETFFGKKNMSDIALKQYSDTKGEKIYGSFYLGSPTLVVKDPELITQVGKYRRPAKFAKAKIVQFNYRSWSKTSTILWTTQDQSWSI